jgi:hypothetical protein
MEPAHTLTMSVGSPVPAFLLLGLVIAAAILLLVGYGPMVAIGVLVGLALGIIVIVAVLAVSTRSGQGISFVHWGRGGRSHREPDAALMERHSRDAMRVMGVDDGDLRRVLGLGLMAEVGAARLELIALELRTDGGIAGVVAHTSPPAGMAGHFAEVTVSDDVGTAYAASGQGSGGSSPRASRHEIRFAPAPPGNAKVLTIEVLSFADPFPGRTAALTGPWTFTVQL